MKSHKVAILGYILLLFISNITCTTTREDNPGLTPNEQRIANIVIASFMMALGLVFLLLGYRIFRIMLCIVGFVVFLAIMYFTLSHNTQLKWWICLIIAIAVSALLTVTLYFIWIVGVLMAGFALGAIIGVLLMATPLGTKVLVDRLPHILFIVILGLVFGVLALIFQRLFIIISTSLLGSYLIIAGIDIIAVHTNVLTTIISRLFGKDKTPWNPDTSWKLYVLIGAIVALTIIGSLLQALVINRRYDHTRVYNKGYVSIQYKPLKRY